MGLLDGQGALVTGAGSGIGRAIARLFAEQGATVGALDLDADAAEATAAPAPSGRIIPLVADVSDRAALAAAADRVARAAGRLDILVSNAVWTRSAPIEEVEEAALDRMFAVSVKGAFFALQAAIPHFRAAGGGAAILMSSVIAERGMPRASAYAAMKGALNALARQAAGELGPLGVRVNAIAPGPVTTDVALRKIPPEGWAARLGQTPLGRAASPDDVAAMALFLAAESGRSVSGRVMVVDGGRDATQWLEPRLD